MRSCSCCCDRGAHWSENNALTLSRGRRPGFRPPLRFSSSSPHPDSPPPPPQHTSLQLQHPRFDLATLSVGPRSRGFQALDRARVGEGERAPLKSGSWRGVEGVDRRCIVVPLALAARTCLFSAVFRSFPFVVVREFTQPVRRCSLRSCPAQKSTPLLPPLPLPSKT